jgi:chitin-binding protein
VPARSGRHVIYAEWGRNQFTFERFSSCMDVVFQGGPPIDAKIGLTPNVTEFTGAGTITLDGSTSVGAGLTYHWGVTAANQSLYTLTNADQRVATLALANPSAAESISISLVVSNSTSGSDVANLTVIHHPSQPSPWFDLGVLNNAARPLIAGNRISMRVVQNGGQDVFLPNVPLVVTAADAAADGWPFDLATAVNALAGNIRIGVLGAQNVVTPVRDATANRVFSVAGAGVTGAFLQVAPANATCRVNYQFDTQWGNGFQASVTITNTATIPVVGYTLTWAMSPGEGFTSGWNATFTPSGQGIAAANTAGQWNGVLAPNGGTSSFGFVGSKGTAPAVIPTSFRLNGDPCATGQTASITVPTNPASGIAAETPMPAEHCNHVPYPGPQPARQVTTAVRRGSRTRWLPLRRRRVYRAATQNHRG